MLDDLKYIHHKDAQDALGAAEKQHKQLTDKIELVESIGTPKNILFVGMGGSAAAAMLTGQWLDISVPMEIWSSYDAPSYVSQDMLCIAVSYSGGTEETLSAIDKSASAGAQIVIITSGGKMAEIAEKNNYPLILLPKTDQPRFGTFSNLVALVTILEKAGVCKAAIARLEQASEQLSSQVDSWLANVPTSQNYAKQLALEIAGTTPIIHAGPKMYPAAHKWKIDLNENAKNVAFSSQLPEFSHNEFIGWTSHPVDKLFTVVDLRSSFEHERVQKRFEVTERLLSGRRPHPISIEAKGDTELAQLLYHATLGVFVSIYVALLNGQNPTPVELVNAMKDALND